MTCEDARECFLDLLEGKIRLTELAGVEAHISQCATCREEVERLQSEKLPARASRGPSADESEGAALPERPGRRWLRFSIALGLAAVVAMVMLTVLAVRRVYHHRVRRADPWDCGFGRLTRMRDPRPPAETGSTNRTR